jgi:predicted Zn-dependent protease
MHLKIGRALLAGRQGDFEAAAAKEFAQELENDPSNANAAYELGEILRRRGELAKARELFQLAVKHFPDFYEAHTGLGRVLLALDQAATALAHLQRAVSLNPDNPSAYFHLARAHQLAGNAAEQQKALATFRRMQSDALKQQEINMKVFSRQEATGQEPDTPSAP